MGRNLGYCCSRIHIYENATNTTFATSDGLIVTPNDSNAIPKFVKNDDTFVTPTIGLIEAF